MFFLIVIYKLSFSVNTVIQRELYSSPNRTPAPKPRMEAPNPYTYENKNGIAIALNVTFSQTGTAANLFYRLIFKLIN